MEKETQLEIADEVINYLEEKGIDIKIFWEKLKLILSKPEFSEEEVNKFFEEFEKDIHNLNHIETSNKTITKTLLNPSKDLDNSIDLVTIPTNETDNSYNTKEIDFGNSLDIKRELISSLDISFASCDSKSSKNEVKKNEYVEKIDITQFCSYDNRMKDCMIIKDENEQKKDDYEGDEDDDSLFVPEGMLGIDEKSCVDFMTSMGKLFDSNDNKLFSKKNKKSRFLENIDRRRMRNKALIKNDLRQIITENET